MGCELRPGIRWATEPVLAARRGEVPDNVYNHKVIPRWEHCFGGKRVRRRTDMAAYIIVDIDIHDVEGMKEYRERVPSPLYLARNSKTITQLLKEHGAR